MLDSLKQAGENIGRELVRTWEGWHELLSRNSNVLTHFPRNNKNEAQPESSAPVISPRCSLLAG